jgi:hypothetical protein
MLGEITGYLIPQRKGYLIGMKGKRGMLLKEHIE